MISSAVGHIGSLGEVLSNSRRDLGCDFSYVGVNIGFPKTHHTPACLAQATGDCLVAATIGCDFCEPIYSVGSPLQRLAQFWPPAAVPEVTIAEDGDSRINQNDIGDTEHELIVSSEP